MDVDSSQIPVEPIPFEHGLFQFAQGLTIGRPRIVAIGSSTTSGEGDVKPYPERLHALLQARYSNPRITMVNQGIGGQEAPAQLLRFDADVIAQKPDLVIWQVGTNSVWQPANEHPPTFEETTAAIRKGLVRLKEETKADVVLMDLQYVPAMLTPAKREKTNAMVEAIGRLAQDAGVNVFRRFAFMKGLIEVERASFDRMVNPDDDHRLHQSDWVTGRLAWAMRLAIVGGVDKARAADAKTG